MSILFFWDVLFYGKTFYAFDVLNTMLPWSALNTDSTVHNILITDPLSHVLPYNQLFAQSVQQGKIPFWDSYTLSGLPFEPPTYPVRALFLSIFEPIRSHDYFLLIHLIASGLLFYFMLRDQQLDYAVALFGAVAWMFTGYSMVWFEFEFIIIISALLPAGLLVINRAIQKPTLNNFFWLTLVFALILSSGFYQLTILSLLFLGCYFLYRLYQQPRESINVVVFGFSGAFLASCLIALPFFIPKILILLNETPIQRPSFSYQMLFSHVGKLLPEQLLMFWFPNLFTNPAGVGVLPFPGQMTYQYNNFNEFCLYTGMTTIILAITSVLFIRNNDIKFFLISTVIVLLMLMGGYWYYPIYQLPGFDLTTPSRMLIISAFCICILAARTLQLILDDKAATLRLHLFWSLLAVSIILTAGAIYTGAGLSLLLSDNARPLTADFTEMVQNNFMVLLQPVMLMLLTVMLLLVISFRKRHQQIAIAGLIFLTLVDLVPFATNYNTRSDLQQNFPQTPMVKFLEQDSTTFRTASMGKFFHNYLANYGIEDLGGYQSIYPRSYAELIQLTQGYNGTMPGGFSRWVQLTYLGHPLLSMMGLKYIVLPAQASISLPQLQEVYRQEVSIYRNHDAFDRAYFVCGSQRFSTEAELFSALSNADLNFLKTTVTLYSNTTQDKVTPATVKPAQSECGSKVEIAAYQNGEMTLTVENQDAGYLVISNQFNNHWRLADGDENIPIERANHTFLAARLEPGNHLLKLSFEPGIQSFIYRLSIVVWTGIGIFIIGYCVRRYVFVSRHPVNADHNRQENSVSL